MDYSIKTGEAGKTKTTCLMVGIFSDGKLSNSAKELDKLSEGSLSDQIKAYSFSGEIGQSQLLLEQPGISAKQILLLGCGDEGKLNPEKFKKIYALAAAALKKHAIADSASTLIELNISGISEQTKLCLATQAQEATLYAFDQFKEKPKKKKAEPKKHFYLTPSNKAAQKGLEQGKAIAGGICLAKDLGNLPGNICNPTYLANEARKLSRQFKSVSTQILSDAELKKQGLNSLLAVSQGSEQPAKLIIMQYNGGKKGDKPEVLVGKGVTFDSGGISLKPGAGMDEMKYDMCGAASVFGTMQALAELGLAINVVGIVPAVENMPSGAACRPGDIVKTMSGKTVEILNTDAEGRLILCDALTYAAKYKPAHVIDIATLTGACVIALGAHASAVYSNDENLTDAIIDAGKDSSDRGWPMPMWDEYQEQIKSPFADIANIGGRPAGSITAACFLSRFTKDYSWAHLDIAGTAWVSGGEKKGGTGRPVAMLTQYLINAAAN